MNNPHLKARVLLKLPTTPFPDNFRVADNSGVEASLLAPRTKSRPKYWSKTFFEK